MATTRDAVYRALLTRVQTIVAAGGSPQGVASSVYLAAVPFLDSGQKSPYIQIVPGVPVEKQTRSGAGGLREEGFDIVVWVRLFQDHGDRQTELLADSAMGMLQLLAIIDGNDTAPGLTNMRLLTELTPASLDGAIRWIRGSAAARDSGNPGWAYGADTYSMQYTVSRERTPS